MPEPEIKEALPATRRLQGFNRKLFEEVQHTLPDEGAHPSFLSNELLLGYYRGQQAPNGKLDEKFWKGKIDKKHLLDLLVYEAYLYAAGMIVETPLADITNARETYPALAQYLPKQKNEPETDHIIQQVAVEIIQTIASQYAFEFKQAVSPKMREKQRIPLIIEELYEELKYTLHDKDLSSAETKEPAP